MQTINNSSFPWEQFSFISKSIIIIFVVITLICVLPIIICGFCTIIVITLIEYCINPEFRQFIKLSKLL